MAEFNNELPTDSLADAPVQEQEVTASPEPELEVQTEESSEPEKAESKTYTQEELDAIISKRLAKQQRKFERSLSTNNNVPDTPTPHTDNLSPDDVDFKSLVAKEAKKLLEQQTAQSRRAEVQNNFLDREEDARDKYDDYDQVVRNANVPFSEAMTEAIIESDIGPDLAYYLGSNIKEAHRIASLSPLMQVKEIGKLEVKLSDSQPVKKVTSAPAPIKPVHAKAASVSKYDTTDPRSTESMSVSEWIEAERLRQLKLAQAKYKR